MLLFYNNPYMIQCHVVSILMFWTWFFGLMFPIRQIWLKCVLSYKTFHPGGFMLCEAVLI